MNSLSRRLTVAVALLVGVYALALVVAVGCLALAVLMWTTELPQNVFLTLACVATGAGILTAIVPRRLDFEAPGPLLTPTEHPLLRALVGEVAARTGQPLPDQIYLDPELNAAVCDTGGLRGGEGGRVMIIGLPLLAVLSVGQLRAVLAHEFGHYQGGDTRVSAWFLRAYDAIARTVAHLEEAGSVWRRPFKWYFNFFLRRTAAIKRRQEYFADQLAVRTAGRSAAVEGLRTIEREWEVFARYWHSEATAVLQRGRRPALLDGFLRFRASEEGAAAREHSAVPRPPDPYDTHPTTPERLAAMERLDEAGPAPAPGDDGPAVALLGASIERLEIALLSGMAGPEAARSLEPIAWEDVPEQVIVPGWRRYAEEHRAAFEGLTVIGLAGLSLRVQDLVAALSPAAERPRELDEQRALVVGAVGTAFALALRDAGWSVEGDPGDPIVCRREAAWLAPWSAVGKLAAAEISGDQWRRRADELGIANLRLDGAAGQGAAAA